MPGHNKIVLSDYSGIFAGLRILPIFEENPKIFHGSWMQITMIMVLTGR